MNYNKQTIIGITADMEGDSAIRLNNTYVRAVENAGGIPIVLPYGLRKEAISARVEICDGIIFSGGDDIDPAYYSEQKLPFCGNIQRRRDEQELCILKAANEAEIPIIAICRGAQLVNVALGGSLYQDINTQCSASLNHMQTDRRSDASHSVKIINGTPLFDLIKKDRITVNSFHHQAVKHLADGLTVMALSEDGIIEAFCRENRYLMCYQWHPERLFDTESSLIFSDFISTCYYAKQDKTV